MIDARVGGWVMMDACVAGGGDNGCLCRGKG